MVVKLAKHDKQRTSRSSDAGTEIAIKLPHIHGENKFPFVPGRGQRLTEVKG